MYSEPDPAAERRMVAARQDALARLGWEPDGDALAWGWQASTLSGPVTTPGGPGWLRVASAAEGNIGGKGWTGPADAEAAIPAAVPRPRLLQRAEWREGNRGCVAELYERLAATAVPFTEPAPSSIADLPTTWWAQLADALTTIASVPTARVAVRQAYLDQAMPAYLGAPVCTTPPAWTTAHGDLHWANLTAPRLMILDWERWGAAPAGYDAAILYVYSLRDPRAAAAVRHHLGYILDTPEGRFASVRSPTATPRETGPEMKQRNLSANPAHPVPSPDLGGDQQDYLRPGW